jgi:prevent-host-death family protein
MKIAALADVKAHLSAYVDECENEGPVIITRNGKAAAVLLAPKDKCRFGTADASPLAPVPVFAC